MAEHLWTVLAQRLVIDAETNNSSIIDVLEQLAVPADLPVVTGKGSPPVSIPIRWGALTLWRRKDQAVSESFDVRTNVLGPKSQKLLSAETKVELAGKHQRFRVKNRFVGLPFVGFGTYSVVIEAKYGTRWRKVDTQFLEILPIEPGSQVKKQKAAQQFN